MSEEERNRIVSILNELCHAPCSRCGKSEFTLIDGYNTVLLSDKPGNIVIGGPAIPCAVTACTTCGHVSLHALAPLGLMPKQENADGPAKQE